METFWHGPALCHRNGKLTEYTFSAANAWCLQCLLEHQWVCMSVQIVFIKFPYLKSTARAENKGVLSFKNC